jgi:molybdopterin-guanine dinucleotide biosynthesis protein A
MGRDKALVQIAGRPLVEWVASALRAVTPDVVLVGRPGKLAGLDCVPDDHPVRRGPMAGLATALRLSGDRTVLLAAVDQPWARIETLAALLALAGPLHAVVPIAGGARQVTCATYPGSWAGRVAAEDAADGSIQSLLDELLFRPVDEPEWQSWGEDGRSWFSVDSHAELDEGLARFGPPG